MAKKYKINYFIKHENDLDLSKLEIISKDNIDILYENDIWDGPLEGLCIWKKEGNKYYYHNISDLTDSKNPRTYILIKLTNEQLINEESLHAAYEKYIESHPYVEHGNTSYRKDAEWDKYHEECLKYPDQVINEDQIVAQFEW